MDDLERALTVISAVASTVVAKSLVEEKDKEKSFGKWTADVEILLMSALFAFPKYTDNVEHTKQKKKVAEKCAVIIATQILELVKLGGTRVDSKHPPASGGRRQRNLEVGHHAYR